ncbi:hypothetical protein EDC01DRAFT_270398 [Geopyxis carbonaria]|nr:hypothetical protein EDC01DRAFT_270398 [Geopyxis carbonaria]
MTLSASLDLPHHHYHYRLVAVCCFLCFAPHACISIFSLLVYFYFWEFFTLNIFDHQKRQLPAVFLFCFASVLVTNHFIAYLVGRCTLRGPDWSGL